MDEYKSNEETLSGFELLIRNLEEHTQIPIENKSITKKCEMKIDIATTFQYLAREYRTSNEDGVVQVFEILYEYSLCHPIMLNTAYIEYDITGLLIESISGRSPTRVTIASLGFISNLLKQQKSNSVPEELISSGIITHLKNSFDVLNPETYSYILQCFESYTRRGRNQCYEIYKNLKSEYMIELAINSNNQEVIHCCCNIIKNMSFFILEEDVGYSFSNFVVSLWKYCDPLVADMIWILILVRNSITSKWTNMMVDSNLINIINESFPDESLDYSYASLYCILRFLKDGGIFSFDLNKVVLLLQSKDEKMITLGLWGIIEFIKLNKENALSFYNIGILEVVSHIQESCTYKIKEQCIACICSIIQSIDVMSSLDMGDNHFINDIFDVLDENSPVDLQIHVLFTIKHIVENLNTNLNKQFYSNMLEDGGMEIISVFANSKNNIISGVSQFILSQLNFE